MYVYSFGVCDQTSSVEATFTATCNFVKVSSTSVDISSVAILILSPIGFRPTSLIPQRRPRTEMLFRPRMALADKQYARILQPAHLVLVQLLVSFRRQHVGIVVNAVVMRYIGFLPPGLVRRRRLLLLCELRPHRPHELHSRPGRLAEGPLEVAHVLVVN